LQATVRAPDTPYETVVPFEDDRSVLNGTHPYAAGESRLSENLQQPTN